MQGNELTICEGECNRNTIGSVGCHDDAPGVSIASPPSLMAQSCEQNLFVNDLLTAVVYDVIRSVPGSDLLTLERVYDADHHRAYIQSMISKHKILKRHETKNNHRLSVSNVGNRRRAKLAA
jgi:hypothetical protein